MNYSNETKEYIRIYYKYYNEADKIISKYGDICKIQNNMCIAHREKLYKFSSSSTTCCHNCESKSLNTKTGCTIKSLGCKLWLCYYIKDTYPMLAKELQKLKSNLNFEPVPYGIFQSCYSDVQRTLKYQISQIYEGVNYPV